MAAKATQLSRVIHCDVCRRAALMKRCSGRRRWGEDGKIGPRRPWGRLMQTTGAGANRGASSWRGPSDWNDPIARLGRLGRRGRSRAASKRKPTGIISLRHAHAAARRPSAPALWVIACRHSIHRPVPHDQACRPSSGGIPTESTRAKSTTSCSPGAAAAAAAANRSGHAVRLASSIAAAAAAAADKPLITLCTAPSALSAVVAMASFFGRLKSGTVRAHAPCHNGCD